MASYRLLDRIGSGGMGSVYRGLQLGLNREVALKLLAIGQSEEALARFRREAATLASISHPHIVRVLDHGELDGSPFLAMEMVEGRSLESLKGSPMPLEQAVPVLVDLADALAHLAAHGIVHRDVKPQNVMIDRHSSVRLVDFGVSHDPNRTPITSAGQVLGTPMYLAPEAMIGEPVTPAVDVWGLALIAHELISGEQWCAEKRRDELFRRILKGPAPVLAGVPGWLAELQARALRTDPGARPSAAEYRDALLLGAGPSRDRAPAPRRAPSRPVPKPSRSHPPPPARRKLPLGALLAAGLAAVGLIAAGTRKPALPVMAPASAAPARVTLAPQEVACYPTERDVCVRVLFRAPAPRTAQLTSEGSSQVLAKRTLGGRHERVRFTNLAPSTRYRVELKDADGHRVATVPFTTRGPEHAQWVERLTTSMGDYLSMRFAVEEADLLPDARLSAALARAVLKHIYDEATIVLACRLLDRLGEPVLAGTCRHLLTERLSPLMRAAVVHALARLGDERAEKLAIAELETCTVPRALEFYADALVASAQPGAFDAIARAAARSPDGSVRLARALAILDASRVPALVTGWLSNRSTDAVGRSRRQVASYALGYVGELGGWPDGALDDDVPGKAVSALWFLACGQVSGARAALDSYRGPGRAMPEWVAVTAMLHPDKELVSLESPTAEQRRLEAWRRGEQEGPPDKPISSESSKWLSPMLADPDPGVAEMAAWRAGHIRDRSQREALLARIRAHPESAGMTAWALARLGGPEARAGVEHALEVALARRADPSVQAQLAWAAGQLGDPGGPMTRGLVGQPAWLTAFFRAGDAWRTAPQGTTSFLVHSAVPFVRTGLILEAGEGVEIDAETVRTPGRKGRTEPFLVPGAWAGLAEVSGTSFPRILVAPRRAELVLSAWLLPNGLPHTAASEQIALIRFLVRR